MEFWNSALTEKSWNALLKIQGKFDFIVIGGWAAYLWTGLHKSKDIDIAIKDLKVLAFLKENFNLLKNDSLKKYEIKFDEIDLGIYAPHFSKLAIPVEDLKKYTAKVQNFEVVKPEALLLLKQCAEEEREKSVKGGKDRIDIVTLLFYSEVDFGEYFRLLKQYKLEHYYLRLRNILQNFREINYIDMNPREFKLKKNEIIGKLRSRGSF
jgi:hypothetical protein